MSDAIPRSPKWDEPMWWASSQRMRTLEVLSIGREVLNQTQKMIQGEDLTDEDWGRTLFEFEHALLNLLARLEGFV